MRAVVVTLALVAVALTIGSRFYPTVSQVAVVGNSHYRSEEVLALANVGPGDPLLWVNTWRLARLANDPWVERVRVLRHWPEAISIALWERTPLLTDGTTVWSRDGTVLPGVDAATRAALVHLDGWGSSRLDEALELAALLAPFGPEVISYSPEGFDIQLADATLFTPSVDALEHHWAAFTSQRGGRMAVYPWGVSKGYD